MGSKYTPYAFNKNGTILYTIILVLIDILIITECVNVLVYGKNKVACGLLILMIHESLADVCLFLGVYKKSRSLFLPHLILHSLYVFVSIITAITLMFFIPLVYPIVILLVCGVAILLWIGIYGHFQELEIKNSDGFHNELLEQVEPPAYEDCPIDYNII